MTQQTLGDDGGEIPDIEFFEERLQREVTETDYQDYYRYAYSHLSSLAEGEVTTKEEFIDSIPKDVQDDTKWQKGRRVLGVKPEFASKVVDGFPSGAELVVVAAQQRDIEPNQISQSDINEVQRQCEDFTEEFRLQHANFFLTDYQRQAEGEVGVVPSSQAEIEVEEYQSIQKRFRQYMVQEYRTELVSLDQSITSSGGSANEELAKHALVDGGLTADEGFEDVSQAGWDITIYSERDSEDTIGGEGSLYVEVKSTGLRERAVKGIADTDDPTVLFGFFDEPNEIKGKVDALREGAFLTYLPPDKLAEANAESSEDLTEKIAVLEGTEYRFLRSNTRFGDDMEEFYRTGDVPTMLD